MSNRYTRKMKCVNLVISLLIAIVVIVPGAMALPAYLTPLNTLYGPGLSCETCHVDPSGGSRTTYGTLFENQTNHATDATAALTAIGSPTPVVATTASRTIDNSVLMAGNSTNVTVVVNDDVIRALSLKETIPTDWTISSVSGDAEISKVKNNTVEWAWLMKTVVSTKTAKYVITVPLGTAPGIYNVNGNVSTDNVSDPSIPVTGDNTITVQGTTVEDTIVPTTTLSGVVEGGVYTGNVAITLSATDNLGGSGIMHTTYSLNNAAMSIYSSPITVTNVGQNTLAYMSTDNAGNIENINTINFTINNGTSVGTFGFTVTPLSETVGVGNIAVYNLTLTNIGNVTDTYNLVADKLNNAIVTLSKDTATVEPGNSAVVGLTVVSSVTGVYVVNVNATSEADKNNTEMVTTTTTVIIPALTIENLISVPSSAISSTHPAKISADVTKGLYNITQVEFGIVDSNNLLGKGSDTVLVASKNISGAEGSYSPETWPATYITLGNVAVADVVSVSIGDASQFARVIGVFNANDTSNGIDAAISFDRTTGKMLNITDFATGEPLTVQNANSTFQARTIKFATGNVELGDASANIFTLYSMIGNVAVDNPSITVNAVPDGNYKVYAIATDTNGSVYQLIDINTVPESTGGGGSSGSGGSGGNGGGTYPTVKATPMPTRNVTAVPTPKTTTATPMPTVTTVKIPVTPVATTGVSITPVATKKSPGIGIVAAIGIIGTIYIIRRRK